ncbi:MAG TPA: hypothetical protein VMM18_00395, partial [Gemmatimonadaceae bacterium]|nr:hypothetical protein [Gemmatimonadaceae bacterium]
MRHAFAPLLALLALAACARRTPIASTSAPAPTDRRALWLDPSHPEWRTPAPPVSHIRFETTRGVFVVELVRESGPIGADRF